MAMFSYVFWGLVTIFWRWLKEVPLIEIIAHRALWSLVFVGLWLTVLGQFGEVRKALADGPVRRALVFSGLLLFFNWFIFVWAVTWVSVLEVSFGYFINPLMSVALGMVLLGERLNRAQQLAVLLALLAVIVEAVALGTVPFVALLLAGTFATYGYVRKTVAVGPAPGLFIECVAQLPIALAILAWCASMGQSHLLGDAQTTALLIATGPVTALPLITFAAAARRLSLATMGLMQYFVPSLQFALALTVFHEPLGWVKLATFCIIWLGLAIFTVDAVRRDLRHRGQGLRG